MVFLTVCKINGVDGGNTVIENKGNLLLPVCRPVSKKKNSLYLLNNNALRVI